MKWKCKELGRRGEKIFFCVFGKFSWIRMEVLSALLLQDVFGESLESEKSEFDIFFWGWLSENFRLKMSLMRFEIVYWKYFVWGHLYLLWKRLNVENIVSGQLDIKNLKIYWKLNVKTPELNIFTPLNLKIPNLQFRTL